MRSLSITSGQPGGSGLHKLWVSAWAFPQVGFASSGLRTTHWLVRSLFELSAQASTQLFSAYNNAEAVFVHIIHTPNNKYYKGD